MKEKIMTVEEMEKLFEEGDEKYLEYFDLNNAHHPGLEEHKVNVILPDWMIRSLDSEAKRLGITRQAIIKVWLDEKLSDISA